MHLPAPFRRLRAWTRRYAKQLLVVFGLLSVAYYFCLPEPLFEDPYSTILLDAKEDLLGAKIATDGQWRFPPRDSVPLKFAQALLQFEDKRFYQHWGVDAIALGRAIWTNVNSGSVVSGASTITMQVIRLSRKGKSRSIWEKMIESVLATRLEWRYSKESILALYAAHAPFGGNVVGLEAAAWKYFGRKPSELSWAESAMLAVLPNSPSLIHPGRNRAALQAKRNALLERLWKRGYLDSLDYELALLEPLPQKPKDLPRLAPHLLERAHLEQVVQAKRKDGRLHSTIDARLQQRLQEQLERHHERLRGNQIHNAAILVLEVETGDVLAYLGNTPAGSAHGEAVDIITAQRSTGSILKPFLYAAMINEGHILPQQLFPDIPSQFGGYTPKNYDLSYSGAVPADKALSRSLNVPSVYMLKAFGVGRFQDYLQRMGMSSLTQSADHYGLSLILGGAETTLWELGSMYNGMARLLKHFYDYDGQYAPNSFRTANYLLADSKGRLEGVERKQLQQHSPLSAAAAWHSFEAMQEVVRPGDDLYWKNFQSSGKVAWKTGTSFGFRDAWAVGCTPEHTVAVWVGNADGEGRPGLVGLQAAAPILFDVLQSLGRSRHWFEAPFDEMQEILVCRQSGHLPGRYCPDLDSIWAATPATHGTPCPYHQQVLLDSSGRYQVHSDCVSPADMQARPFFVLPPAQAWYYQQQHPQYQSVPPYRADCQAAAPQQRRKMALIYPKANMRIYIPRELDERKSRTVFEAAHQHPAQTIYWHLDEAFIGTTKDIHQLAIQPKPGKHVLTLVDETGETLLRSFEILETED